MLDCTVGDSPFNIWRMPSANLPDYLDVPRWISSLAIVERSLTCSQRPMISTARHCSARSSAEFHQHAGAEALADGFCPAMLRRLGVFNSTDCPQLRPSGRDRPCLHFACHRKITKTQKKNK